MTSAFAGVLALAICLTAGWWLDGAALHRHAIARHAAGAELPLAAQGPVSRIIGRDDPAYRAVWQNAGLVLRNPGQQLRAQLGRRGIVIRTRGVWVGLSLTGYGYGGTLHDVADVEPRARANRVAYRHGGLVEWYANGPLGIEQGFTLARRPTGRENGSLTLALALTGNLRAARTPAAGDVRFARAGVALSYRGLVATDARGKTLPARIALRKHSLLLRIDDRGATYPLRLDPLIQQEQAKLSPSDSALGDSFGESVAVSGNTIAIGAPDAVTGGAVYVFIRPANGWATETQIAKLTASDGGGQLGYSVGISGNTIVAGAPGGPKNPGAAYMFVKLGSGWVNKTQTAKLTASDGVTYDEFGTSVAVSGNTVVVGAPYNPDVGPGAAYVFVQPGSGWANERETAKLTALQGAQGDALGKSVAVSGNTIVAGAPGGSGTGAAYVFVESASGWTSDTETAKLTASDAVAYDRVGWSVAISGGTIVAGAPTAAGGSGRPQAAYVFAQPAGGWTSETETTALTDGATDDAFGHSVAMSGNTIVAGTPGNFLRNRPGGVYVFALGATLDREQCVALVQGITMRLANRGPRVTVREYAGLTTELAACYREQNLTLQQYNLAVQELGEINSVAR